MSEEPVSYGRSYHQENRDFGPPPRDGGRGVSPVEPRKIRRALIRNPRVHGIVEAFVSESAPSGCFVRVNFPHDHYLGAQWMTPEELNMMVIEVLEYADE